MAMGESGVMVCGVVWWVVVGGVHVGVVCMLVWCGCGVGVVWCWCGVDVCGDDGGGGGVGVLVTPTPICMGWLAGMEVDGDSVAVWQTAEAFDSMPAELISCPLASSDLGQYYSLSRAVEEEETSLVQWQAEVAAQEKKMTQPSLCQKRKADGRTSMQPKQPQIIASRLKSQEQFVGFAVMWQGQQATMGLVMQPQLAAKFFGFLLARGQSRGAPEDGTRGTIKKLSTQLSETVEFVMSEEWPGEQTWTQQWAVAVKGWYANVRNQASVLIFATYKPSPSNLTLWSGIYFTKSKWEEFEAAFQVGGWVGE